MKIRKFSLALLGAVALVLGMSILTATFAATSFSYTVTDLGTLGGSSSQAYGINDTGQVVGKADTSGGLSHAFLWDQGTMNDLGTLDGYSYSSAFNINNVGQAVGYAYIERNSSVSNRALLWNQGAQSPPQDLGSLGGNFSFALDINNRGEVVGTSSLSDDNSSNQSRAFLWSKGNMRNLGILSNSDFSAGLSINNKRQIVGRTAAAAFLWEKGTMRAINTNGKGMYHMASDINERGQAVGVGDNTEATLWNISDGTKKSLGSLGAPGDYYSWAHAINNRGRIVGGTYENTEDLITSNPYHAVLWINDTIKDLNSFIPANSGWELQTAQDINNFGQIVGYGKHNGQTKAFLLTPTWTTN